MSHRPEGQDGRRLTVNNAQLFRIELVITGTMLLGLQLFISNIVNSRQTCFRCRWEL
jgi:hypothetical protein